MNPRVLCLAGLLAAGTAASGSIHTCKGTNDLSRIAVTVVYFLPRDRPPVPDWRDRIDFAMRRVAAFHEREFSGLSVLDVRMPGEPLVSELTADKVREGDATAMFERMAAEARTRAGWPGHRDGAFPVLLMFSDQNHRELDDFTRTRIEDGAAVHEGHIGPDGRHHPGAKSGGSRARMDRSSGGGIALVTADGWRVPYEGSDCVAYHEGLGHTLGLPHPEPANRSVMSTAQYHMPIHRSWIDADQKQKMGWAPPVPPPPSNTLFGAFHASHEPATPLAGDPVRLDLSWPEGARVASIATAIQTDLFGPWHETAFRPPEGTPPAFVSLGAFSSATPVSWRVRVELADGRREELWGYFQVADPASRAFGYDYKFEPAGKRIWRTSGPDLWTELDPAGRLKVFRITVRGAEVDGRRGTVAAELPGKHLEVFIPDRGTPAPHLLFRLAGEKDWKALGEIHDSPR